MTKNYLMIQKSGEMGLPNTPIYLGPGTFEQFDEIMDSKKVEGFYDVTHFTLSDTGEGYVELHARNYSVLERDQPTVLGKMLRNKRSNHNWSSTVSLDTNSLSALEQILKSIGDNLSKSRLSESAAK